MPNEKLSVQDFAAQIKAKYPQYKEYDDTVLTEAILDKYPVYKGQVDYAPKKKEVTPLPSSAGESVSPLQPEQLETATNPFMDKLYELDAAFGEGIANTPILGELVAGSNRIVSGLLDYANMTMDYTLAAMVPGGESYNDKFNYVQSVTKDNALDRLADTWANNADYIRQTRNANAGISKQDAEKGIVGLLGEGEFSKAAFLTLSGATEAVPSIALAASTGLAPVSLSAGGSKYREIADNPLYSPLERYLFANASGIVEGLSEMMGGSDLRAMRSILGNKQALNAYRNEFISAARKSDIYKQMGKAGLEEGFEEAIVASFDEAVSSIKEGRSVNYSRIADDFLVGLTAGGGTMVTANGMNARGSLKNEKARAKYAQQVKDLQDKKAEVSGEQANAVDNLIKKNISALRTLIDQDAQFFGTFSDEDQKRIREIDRKLNEISKQREMSSDDDQLYMLQTEAVELMVEKDSIEAKYRSEEENNITANASQEELDEIRRVEATIIDKKQRLENTESERTKEVIQSQIDALQLELDGKKKEVLGRVAPKQEVAPKEEFTPEEEPAPVTVDLEVPKDAQPANFEDLMSGRVTIKTVSGKTEMGRIIDEGNGKMSVLTDEGNIIELGNIEDLRGVEASTLGLAQAEQIVSIEGNEITVRGQQYTNNYSDPLAAINRDADGNIQSVTLDAADGTKRTFRGTTGDEIAYNIIMSQYSDAELEQELENLAQQDEETNTELSPTPEAEVTPAPETTPDPEQTPDQEPEVKPEPAPAPAPAPETEVKPAPQEDEDIEAEPAKEQTDKDSKAAVEQEEEEKKISKKIRKRTPPKSEDSGKKPLADLYSDDMFNKDRLAVEKELIGKFQNLYEFLKHKMKSSFKDYETPVSTITDLYMLNKEGGFTAITPKKKYSVVFKVTTGSKGEWSLFIDNKGVDPIGKRMKAINKEYGSLENFAIALLGGNSGGKNLETAKSIIKDIKDVAEKQYLESDAGKDGMTVMPGQNSVDKFIDKIAAKYGLYSPSRLEQEIQNRLNVVLTNREVNRSSESEGAFSNFSEYLDYFEENPEAKKRIDGPVFPKSYGLNMSPKVEVYPNGMYNIEVSYDLMRKGQAWGSSTLAIKENYLKGLPFEEALEEAFNNIENAIFKTNTPVYTEKEIAKIISIIEEWQKQTLADNEFTKPKESSTKTDAVDSDMPSRFEASGDMTSGNPNVQWKNEEDFYSQVTRGTGMSDEFKRQVAIAAAINNHKIDKAIIEGKKRTSNNELVNKPLDSIERFRATGKEGRIEYFAGREMSPGRGWKAIYGTPLMSKLIDVDDVLTKAGLKQEEAPEQKKPTPPKTEVKAQTKSKPVPSKQEIIDAEKGVPTNLNSESDIKNIQDIAKLGIGVMIESDKEGSKSKKFSEGSNPSTKYGFIGPEYSQNNIQEVKKRIIEFVQGYNSMINSMPEEARPKDMLIDSRKKAIDAIKSYVRDKTYSVGVNKILFDTVTIDSVSKVLTFADAIKQMNDSEFVKLKTYKEDSSKKAKGEPTIIAGVELTPEEAKRAAGYAVPAEDLKNFFIDGQKQGEPFSVPNKEWWEVAKKMLNLGAGVSVRLDIYEGGFDKSKRKRTKDAPQTIRIHGSNKNKAKGVKDVLDFKYKGLKGVEAVNKLEQDYFVLPNPWIKQLESKGNKRKFDPSTVGQVMWGNTGLYGFELISMARAFDALSKGKAAKKLVLDGYESDNFSDYAADSTLPQDIKDLKAEGFDVEKEYVSAVAKAFNETEEAVRKALGFEAITDDSEIIAVKYPKTEELTGADVAPSGAYTDQKTQTVNSKEVGPVKFKSSMVSKNKTGELTIQQRIYEENDTFNLTGPETIQGPEDVAFLLRHLESAASENAFLVIANKDGDYKTVWLGTGTQTSQAIDPLELAAGIDSARYDLKGDEVFVYFVHNHPSGNLSSSPADKRMFAKLEAYVNTLKGVTLMDGLIVNLDSGQFTTFNSSNNTGTPDVRKTKDLIPAPVYSFSRKEVYVPSSERVTIMSSNAVSRFMTNIKVKNTNKIGHIVLDQSNSITYFAFVQPNISGAEWARTMAVDVGRHGKSIIVVGPSSESKKVQTAVNAFNKMQLDASVLDSSATTVNVRTDEPTADYIILEEPTPEFSEEQGYKPLSEDELDHPSRVKSFLDMIKGYKWSQVQKEVIKYEEARGSKVAIKMKGLGKALNQLKRDLGGTFFARKTQGITKEEALKGQMLAHRFMSESNKSAVVDDILKLKNGERILKNLRILRMTFDDASTALATESTFSKLPQETRENILDNLGVYLHRSYRFFEDPTYRFKFGKAGKLLGLDKAPRNQAVEAEFMILHNNWIQKLMDEAGYTREQAIQSTLVRSTKGKNKGYSKRDLLAMEAKNNIDMLIKEYNDLLEDRKKMRAQGKGTNIPNSAFLEKKDIPVHIRELLGEVKDPIAIMAATGQTLFNIYEKGKMVEILSDGIYENLKNVYAKEEYGKNFSKLDPKQQQQIVDRVKKEPMIKLNKDITDRDKATFKQINDPMSPLNTRWVHKDIVEIIQASPIYDTGKTGLEGGFTKAYFFALKNLRMVNVLLNTPTWGKNALGTLYFSAANGWFNPAKQAKNLKASVEGLLKGDETYFKMLEEMAENGLIGQSFNVNQIGLSGFAYYYGTTGDKSFYDKYVGRVKNMNKKVLADLGSLYASIDDFGKMSIYQNERASFARKMFGEEYENLSASQQSKVRAAAAERVKDNTPTWGRITKAGRSAQRLPMGDFQGFRFEAFRSTYRIVRNTMDDLNTLMNDDSLTETQKKEYRLDIARKMFGLGFVGTSAPYAVIKAMSYGSWALSSVMSLFGLGGDEEDREKKLEVYDSATVVRPGWLKHHKVWVKSIDNDLKVRVYDYTGFDPYAEVFGFDGYFSVMKDVVQPNMAVNIFTAIAKNQDVYGRDIADPSEPTFRQVMDLAKYAGSQFLPSILTSSYRDASKRQGEIDKVKRYLKLQGLNPKDFNLEEVNVPKETLKLINDRKLVRDYEYDMVQQFNYAVKGYKKSFGENYLTSKYPEHRKEILDDVMKMYTAVVKVAAYKGNYEKIDEATKIIERNFDDTEVSYMFYGSDYSDAIPKGYFD